MEWLSSPTKKLLLEMSVGVVLYNLLLGALAWVLLPKFSYPVIPALRGLLAGAVGAVLMLIHMAVTTERALESQNESYASRTTIVQSMIRKVVLVAALFAAGECFRVDLLAMVSRSHGHESGRIPAAADSQDFARGDEPHTRVGGEDSRTEEP